MASRSSGYSSFFTAFRWATKNDAPCSHGRNGQSTAPAEKIKVSPISSNIFSAQGRIASPLAIFLASRNGSRGHVLVVATSQNLGTAHGMAARRSRLSSVEAV